MAGDKYGVPRTTPELSPPRGTTEWLDWLAPREGRAFYAITAVNRQGNESEPAFAEAKE